MDVGVLPDTYHRMVWDQYGTSYGRMVWSFVDRARKRPAL